MNVTAHQKKEKNEKKTGMKKGGERRRRATDFRKAVCCPSAVVQRAARRKMVRGECPGRLGLSVRPIAISTQPKRGRGPHHHVEAAVDWYSFSQVGENKKIMK